MNNNYKFFIEVKINIVNKNYKFFIKVVSNKYFGIEVYKYKILNKNKSLHKFLMK